MVVQTQGNLLLAVNALISWKCKKQDSISKSSIEAEYHTMFTTCFEMIWLCGLLTKNNQLRCMLTTLVLYILQQIQFTMNEQNTLKLIITRSKKRMIIESSINHISQYLFKQLIFLLKV
ncbi:hypothetical protein CR513_18266, partial [Mucuna pruriens]